MSLNLARMHSCTRRNCSGAPGRNPSPEALTKPATLLGNPQEDWRRPSPRRRCPDPPARRRPGLNPGARLHEDRTAPRASSLRRHCDPPDQVLPNWSLGGPRSLRTSTQATTDVAPMASDAGTPAALITTTKTATESAKRNANTGLKRTPAPITNHFAQPGRLPMPNALCLGFRGHISWGILLRC